MTNTTVSKINRVLNCGVVRFLHKLLLLMVGTYGVLLVFFSVSLSLVGQSQQSREDDLTRRVAVLEGQNLEHRVTVMETILSQLQDNIIWVRLNMGGTGLLIAEAVTRQMTKRRAGERPSPIITDSGRGL